MEEAQCRQDRITHNDRATEHATNSPFWTLDIIQEMEARKHLAIEIIEKSRSKRDDQIHHTAARGNVPSEVR